MNDKVVTPINERTYFEESEIIVSKTDLKGRITYANHVFCRMAEMDTDELIGKPHNIIRHPDMPRCVFKLLWLTLAERQEIFAYVKNMSKSGRYYWVKAHVTPSYNEDGYVSGYHSTRRVPCENTLNIIQPLYANLLDVEQQHSNPKEGLAASMAVFTDMLKDQGKTYDELIWQLDELD